MSNNEPTLNDFVSPIPVCQAAADLEMILQAFEYYKCSEIAIPLADNSWGIIRSSSVLGLFAKLWRQQGVVTLGHARARENDGSAIAQELKHLVEPTIVWSSKVELAIFLQTLNSSQSRICEYSDREYLVVDELGQLKGNLDRSKILKYLASGSTQPSLALNLTIADSLAGLPDLLTLPWKIETSAGQNLHCNSLWEESFPGSQSQNLSDIEIANWWIEQQYGSEQISVSNFQSGYLNFADPILSNFPAELEVIPDVAQNCAALNVLHSDLTWDRQKTERKVEIEQQQEWCLIKIPVSLSPPKKLANMPSSECVLTIATQVFLPPHPSLSASLAIIPELLAILNHELKSPLTGIVGLSSLLQKRQLGKLNQRQALYAQLIHSSGQKLMGIVNDLLELQSLDRDDLSTTSESVSVEHLCRQGYQQSVARLEKLEVESEPKIILSQLKLEIAPESTIATADKLSVISILSHLMLEVLEFADSSNQILLVKVEKQQSNNWQTAIVISNKRRADEKSHLGVDSVSIPKQSSGWNLILAKYLAVKIDGEIQSCYTEKGCQLTLLLPEKIVSKDLIPDSSKQRAKNQVPRQRRLTVLCLYPEAEAMIVEDGRLDLNFKLKNWIEQDWSNGDRAFNCQHRIIEADGLEQAHTLARIWQLDVVLLNGQRIADPEGYLQLFQELSNLAALPLITLDTRTTQAANQIEGLNVYPCLIPAQCRSISDLIQVIHIATNHQRS